MFIIYRFLLFRSCLLIVFLNCKPNYFLIFISGLSSFSSSRTTPSSPPQRNASAPSSRGEPSRANATPGSNPAALKKQYVRHKVKHLVCYFQKNYDFKSCFNLFILNLKSDGNFRVENVMCIRDVTVI